MLCLLLANRASQASTSLGSGPICKLTQLSGLRKMIWDGDDDRDDLLFDESLKHEGEGSDDEVTADDVRQLLSQTAPAQRESED